MRSATAATTASRTSAPTRLSDVRSMVEILADDVGHYIFASSTVMYARRELLPITESHAVDRTSRQSEYGMNKILCEEYLVEQHQVRGFPATMVPFSMVFGPNNIIPDREQRMFVRLAAGRPALIGRGRHDVEPGRSRG